MKIYTKTGDEGTTSLFGGKRVRKDDIRIEAYGTVDELNTFIGLCASSLKDTKVIDLLIEVQKRLFTIGSHLASDPSRKLPVPDLLASDVEILEKAIDNMNENLPALKNFILPGGSQSVAFAHICRTVSRRAERRIITLHSMANVDPIIIQYLNRLSDYFFVLSRKIAHDEGTMEIPWNPRK